MARIVLGATGSVAAIRVPALNAALRDAGHDVRVVATAPALYFFEAGQIPVARDDSGSAIGRTALFRDEDEWPRQGERRGYRPGDSVLHIELRRWADLLLIAPLDANTLAKLAMGLSDNLLTCLYRAWDRDRPIMLAPAMNTYMWEHPLTARHLAMLIQTHGGRPPAGDSLDEALAAFPVPRLYLCAPQSKILACGDEGVGAMAEVEAIAAAVEEAVRPTECGAS